MIRRGESLTEGTIDQFLKYVEQTGRTASTQKAYGTNLKNLLAWSGRSGIPHSDLELSTMTWLTENSTIRKPTTIGQWRASVKEYARWAGLGSDFLYQYRSPRLPPRDAHPIPEGMDGIDEMMKHARNTNELLIVVFCGWMGLRVNEAVTVPACNYDPIDRLLTVKGKGAKQRTLPVYDKPYPHISSVAWAWNYVDEPMVTIANSTARAVITRLGRDANLQRPIKSHDLRATFATDMYERTKDLVAVKEWLGHASVTTTMAYVGTSLASMRAAVA